MLSKMTMAKLVAHNQQALMKSNMILAQVQMRGFYYPDANHHHLNQEPHVLAKRIIRCVGDRLRHIDPHRWDAVPITFKTNWSTPNGENDLRTAIHIHDALEREFNIEIDDRKDLMHGVEDCFHFIMSVHAAV